MLLWATYFWSVTRFLGDTDIDNYWKKWMTTGTLSLQTIKLEFLCYVHFILEKVNCADVKMMGAGSVSNSLSILKDNICTNFAEAV